METRGVKTKMTITEHTAEFEQRHQPQLTGRPTSEELTMIRDYVLYPQLIKMIQKSLDDMGFVHVALKGVILRCLDYIMFIATEEFYALKRVLRQRNIRVVEEETNDEILYYRYYCRGYEERFGILREVLRTELQIRLTAYTKQLGQQLKTKE